MHSGGGYGTGNVTCSEVACELGSLLFSVASAIKRFERREVLGRSREPMSLLRSWKIKGDGATTKISPLTGLSDLCRTGKTLVPWKIGWPNPLFRCKLRLPALPAFNAGRRGFLSPSGCEPPTDDRAGYLAMSNSLTSLTCLVQGGAELNRWWCHSSTNKVMATFARPTRESFRPVVEN